MKKQKTRYLLKQILGNQGGLSSSGQWITYKCPFCHHHKYKFNVNLKTTKWHCWVCRQNGSNVFSLVRRLGKFHYIEQFEKIFPRHSKQYIIDEKITKEQSSLQIKVKLPYGSTPIKQQFLFKNKVVKYLHNRRIDDYLIQKYDIRFVSVGQYKNRIIVPSYDQVGRLNYFVGRTIQKQQRLKYKNPKLPKSDVIMFQNLIDWNYPIYLTEGVFDAISINFNSIPIMGKIPSKRLMQTLLYYDSQVYLVLDSDAEEQQYKLAKRLYNRGLSTVKIVKLNEKDPSLLGHQVSWNRIQNNNQIYDSDYQLNLKMKQLQRLRK